MNKLDGLDVFVAVVEAKSFAGAARKLGMPTTTVSAKVSRLEEQLGVSLLRRTTRKQSLTEAGDAYYRSCAPALQTIEQASAALQQNRSEPQGTLRMTAPPDIAQIALAPIIDTYLKRYPDVHVDLRVTNSFVDLVSEQVDLAIRIGELSDANLVIRTFTNGSLSLWAGSAYQAQFTLPTRPEDLERHRIIWLRTRHSKIDLMGPAGETLSLKSSGWLDVDDLQTLKHYVEQGLGIGLLPRFDLPNLQGDPDLIPVLPQYKTAPFRAVFAYTKQNFVPATVRSFIDTAADFARGRRKTV